MTSDGKAKMVSWPSMVSVAVFGGCALLMGVELRPGYQSHNAWEVILFDLAAFLSVPGTLATAIVASILGEAARSWMIPIGAITVAAAFWAALAYWIFRASSRLARAIRRGPS
jgi:uncharacterized membrane protein HdeD (DUF308 family)